MKKIKEKTGKLKRLIISWFPVIILIIVFLGLEIYFYKSKVYCYHICHFNLLFEILIPSMITFMGFSITIITVFIGLEKEHILLKSIKDDTLKKQFNRYVVSPIIVALIIIIISFISIITVDDNNTMNIQIFIILISSITYFLMTMLRLFLLLFFSFSADILIDEEIVIESDVNDLDL